MAAGLAACSDEPTQSPVEPGEAARRETDASTARGLTLDERFVQLVREVPGFGGYYRDGLGNLNVVLTDPSAQGEAARSALAPVLRDGRGRGMIMRQGRYDFARLHAWRRQVDPVVLGIEGVAFTDVNEVTNRVEVGISDAAVHGHVRRAVSGLSIPQEAVALVDAEAIREHASLKDRVRPTAAGLQIDRVGGSPCTLGFSVLVDGKYGYFTNTHCTQQGTGTVHQQQAEATDRIGVEVQDPAQLAKGTTHTFNNVSYTCTDDDGCRFSDASRGVFDDSVQAQVLHGYIARTLVLNRYQGNDPASYDPDMHTIDGNRPYFRIVGKAEGVIVGDVIHKVGQATGWTSGTVDRTCVNTSNGMFCQLGKGGLLGYGGDSGSPVFIRVPGSETDVQLVGLYWGSYVSPITNIERDMGTTFQVAAPFRPDLVPLPPAVGTSVSPSAVVVDGSTFVYYKGAGTSARIYVTRNNGSLDQGTWTQPDSLPINITTSDAPSAAVIGNTISVVHKGPGGDAWVYLAQSSDQGQSWSKTQLPFQVNTSTRPEALVIGNSLYVVYKGVTGDTRLFVAPTPAGTPLMADLPSDVSSSESPSAVLVNGTTFVFYKGAGTDERIYLTRNTGAPMQGTWTPSAPMPVAVKTSDAPSAITIGSTIYVVYKGAGGDAWVYVARSLDQGATWSRTRMPGAVNTGTRPDAFVSGNSPYVAYKGVGTDDLVYVAHLPVHSVWQPI